MIKTYLYIPEHLNERVSNRARLEKKSKAEILRTALKEGLEKIGANESSSAETLFKLAEIGKKYQLKGVHDSSRIDKLLWGKDWSNNE